MHQGMDVPLGWFTHALDDPIQGVLTALFQSLRDRLDSLLVRGIFEQATEEVVQSQVAMTLGTVFKN